MQWNECCILGWASPKVPPMEAGLRVGQMTSDLLHVTDKLAPCGYLFNLWLSSIFQMEVLVQGYQTHFYWGPHQARGCLQRAKIILRLYKCNYSLIVKELKLHSAL